MKKALAGTLSKYFMGTFSKQGEWREQTQVSWKLSRLQIETFVFYLSAARPGPAGILNILIDQLIDHPG